MKVVEDIEKLHQFMRVPLKTFPDIPSRDRIELRLKLIREEIVDELLPAMEANNLIGIADGLVDGIVVLVGTALEYGLGAIFEQLWDEVQRSNLSKIDPLTGEPIFREDGKFVKPSGWEDFPKIAGIIAREIEIRDRVENEFANSP